MEWKISLLTWPYVSFLYLLVVTRILFTVPGKLSVAWAHLFPLTVLLISGPQMNHLRIFAVLNSKYPFKYLADEMYYSVCSAPSSAWRDTEDIVTLLQKRIWEGHPCTRRTGGTLHWHILSECQAATWLRMGAMICVATPEHQSFNSWHPLSHLHTWEAHWKCKSLSLP